MKTLILMLCVAIGFVLITDPRQEFLPAQEVKAEVQSKKPNADILLVDALNGMNTILGGVIEKLDNQSREIASVEECVTTEVEQLKTRLVAVEAKQDEPPASKAEVDGCDCGCDGKCAEKLADQERRLAAVEARVGMYPTVSSNVSYGSTGTPLANAGSTGTPVVSYGSTGTPTETLRKVRTPIRTMANVVTAPLRSSMTQEQMLDLHDAMHEGDGIDRPGHWSFPGQSIADHLQGHEDNRLQRGIVAYPPVTLPASKVVYSTSNCPGGNCPTSSRVSSSGNGWWLGKNLGFRR